MARRGSELRRALTLGGQAPAPIGALLLLVAAATVAGTASPDLAGWLDLRVPAGAPWLALLQPWRLVTWPLFQGPLPGGLITVLFAGFTLLWVGRMLAGAWSEALLVRRLVVIAAGAGAATLLLLAPLGLDPGFSGLWPIVNALIVSWGLVYPSQRVSWFGVLEMSGATAARAMAIGTPIWALVVGPPGAGVVLRLALFAPHLAAMGVAWLLVGGGPRRLWRRGTDRLRRRALDARKRRFEVIDTRSPERPRWMN